MKHEYLQVVLPVNSDGPANALDHERTGVAEVISYYEVNEENLLTAVKKVLEDPIYTENARKFGSLLTDQINKPLDRAVWHIEHLIRYPGMIDYVRPPVHDLAWYQYAMLDVLAFLLSLVLLLLYFLYKLLSCVCCKSAKPKAD